MTIFCRKIISFALVVLFASQLQAANNRQDFYRNFWLPEYHGLPLNYCTIDGKECGMTVANRYCQIMGYLRADQQIIANNVGLTNYMGIMAHCKGWQCNGFKTIRCVAKINNNTPKAYHYSLRRFVYPHYNKYRLDWCYDGKTGCGRRAAYSFCRRLGYQQVRGYTMQKQIPATKAIGNQKLCFGKQCNGFSEINCYR